jgi:hypothetical protein
LDTRTSSIPIDHQLAEVVAYPVSSSTAFANPFEDFSFSNPAFIALWRQAEADFLSIVPNISLDEIVSLRDHLWFRGHTSNPSVPIPLHRYCWDFTNRLLTSTSGISVPKLSVEYVGDSTHDKSNPEVLARAAWRWITYALPDDFLSAAQGPAKTPLSNCRQTEECSPLIARILKDRGFAETHLHAGAGLNFAQLWIFLLSQLSSNSFPSNSFASPGAAFDQGNDLGHWLIRLAVVRQLLGWFLDSRSQGFKGDFTSFVHGDVRDFLLANQSVTSLATVNSALWQLIAGNIPASNRLPYAAFQTVYRQLSTVFTKPIATNLLSLYECDPLSDHLKPLPDLDISCEQMLIRKGMEYLEFDHVRAKAANSKNTYSDTVFARLFWQVMRLRNIFYRHITQRPMTPGLQFFIRFYSRISAARKPMGRRIQCESLLKTCGLAQGLRSLEIRTSPDPSFSDTYNFIRDMAFHMDQLVPVLSNKDFEFGIVLHLSKDRGGQYRQGLPLPNWEGTHADPGSIHNSSRYRYANYFNSKTNEVLALRDVIAQFPNSLKVVRGFDVCTDEMAVPPWVLKPFFGFLDRLCGRAVNYWKSLTNVQLVLPRKTIHCGEDFVHISTGMRSIAESIEHFGLQDGDRLGHGSALGYSIGSWATRMYRLSMAREVRFFDLFWEWRCYSQHHVPVRSERIEYVKNELRSLGRIIFNRDCTIHEISRFYQQLHNASVLASTGFPNVTARPLSRISDDYKLLYTYLTCRDCFRRCKENIWVPTQTEVEAMEALQGFLRQRVSSLGLTVEINPSSNLLIGQLSDLLNHPLWRMRPPNGNRDIAPLRVCIGSDDPITFATRLPNEYMLLHDAMINAGLGSHVADEWIETARQAGMNARFTLTDWRVQLPPLGITFPKNQPVPWPPTNASTDILAGLEPILLDNNDIRAKMFI